MHSCFVVLGFPSSRMQVSSVPSISWLSVGGGGGESMLVSFVSSRRTSRRKTCTYLERETRISAYGGLRV